MSRNALVRGTLPRHVMSLGRGIVVRHALGRVTVSRHVLGRGTLPRLVLGRGTLPRHVTALGRGTVSRQGLMKIKAQRIRDARAFTTYIGNSILIMENSDLGGC